MEADEFLNADKTNQYAFRVAYLIAGFVQQDLTQSEEAELDDWVGESMSNQLLFEELTDPGNLDKWIKWKEKLPATETLKRLETKLEFSDAPKKKNFLKSLWPYLAAAVFLGGIAVAIKWISLKDKTTSIVRKNVSDIQPGGNRATLTLSDGRNILLDSAATGEIAGQDNTNIIKDDSASVIYRVKNPALTAATASYNTITTPLGGTYTLVLPDGSKVTLNANSSLRFPTAFTGKKRSVTLTGEAYFEIAKDPMFPFEVIASGNNITVLGTHFNINAYKDEPLLKVTLEEGGVRLNNSTTLRPGEQAEVARDHAVKVVAADLEKELAWKNGLFVFRQAPLQEVMRQVARWYNCEVSFQAQVPDHFNASVSRNLPVSTLLDFLAGTGRVHFQIKDKKITVLR